MKIKKSVFAILLAVVMATGLVLGANGAGAMQAVTAYLRPDVTIKMDGEVTIPTDQQGERVYPVYYQGTNYLPIRAVAKMLGVGVDWDQATQTILLGDPKDGVDLIDTIKYYHTTERDSQQVQSVDKKEPINISGINVSHWLGVYTGYWSDKGNTSDMHFNLQAKYDTISFKYYCEKDVILRVLGDEGYLLWEKEIKGGQVAQVAMDIKLLKTMEMTFQTEVTEKGNATVYVFDTRLK